MNNIKIGLIRHFEVKKPIPSGWITSRQLTQWREEYERADISPCVVELGNIHWNKCLSSDSSRALMTAKSIFSGPISPMQELREAQTNPFPTGQLKLPIGGWKWLLRLAWMTSHPSQRTAKEEFVARVQYMTDKILSTAEENTLIVSHAGMMFFLRQELLRLGFTGPNFRVAQNGKLYVFEKK